MEKNFKLPHTSAIILAGGKGTRMGRPKQMLPIAGKPMLFFSIQAFLKVKQTEEIIVVTQKNIQSVCRANFKSKKIKYATPGDTRIDSLTKGMEKISKKSKLVAVHDGARPLVSTSTIKNCLLHAHRSGSAVCALPTKDTIKTSANGKTVEKTLNRKSLWSAHTPQCYKTEILKKALKKFPKDKSVTDESQLVEKLGKKVYLVKSDYKNIKVTTPNDLIATNAMAKTTGKRKIPETKLRIGLGYDLHRSISARPFIIGGVKIPHHKGLLGHSDGDVVLHAVCDAILGAICAGEIGLFFPPTDLTLMGISSTVIAEKTIEILKSKNASLLHLDITIIAEEPKISPYYQTIRQSLAKIFKLPVGEVSFKAKSHEGIGAIGKGNAVAVQALATVIYE
jgi:2-C-methyl-D-erythritol 4-phosphate cytidylyltransferase/2-C-methyl-D-erythritol 2,4-cyclodiphosphate synthase